MASTHADLDGTRTEYFDVECSEPSLLALLREMFEVSWQHVIFGPCIEGAVFEGRFGAPPVLSILDGYATVQVAGSESWHFHLCIGPHRGSPSLPTSPELARWRRCARAAFFRSLDRDGRASAWGVRLWNGRGEQMLTVFFPNPVTQTGDESLVDAKDAEAEAFYENYDFTTLDASQWPQMRRRSPLPPAIDRRLVRGCCRF